LLLKEFAEAEGAPAKMVSLALIPLANPDSLAKGHTVSQMVELTF
jgi:hypothetical protein